MMEAENYPFGETEYKNYDPEQVNTAEDVAILFTWIAHENRKAGDTTAAEVFEECATVVRNTLIEDTQAGDADE